MYTVMNFPPHPVIIGQAGAKKGRKGDVAFALKRGDTAKGDPAGRL